MQDKYIGKTVEEILEEQKIGNFIIKIYIDEISQRDATEIANGFGNMLDVYGFVKHSQVVEKRRISDKTE